MGRPPLFEDRVRFVVYLDRSDLRAIQEAAAARDVSAAEWARRRLVAAVSKEEAMHREPRQSPRRSRRKEGR
jgi:hypothetical protein